MNQRVKLTWWGPDGNKVVEVCRLIHEDTSVFAADGSLVEDGLEMLVVNGRVLFEDEGGQFTLKPKQIIEIERI